MTRSNVVVLALLRCATGPSGSSCSAPPIIKISIDAPIASDSPVRIVGLSDDESEVLFVLSNTCGLTRLDGADAFAGHYDLSSTTSEQHEFDEPQVLRVGAVFYVLGIRGELPAVVVGSDSWSSGRFLRRERNLVPNLVSATPTI